MATITIQRNHRLPLSELKNKIDSIMAEIQEKIDFRSHWENPKEFCFQRKGASGSIEIDQSNFELKLNLGMMFRAMKSTIESRIIAVVDKHIG